MASLLAQMVKNLLAIKRHRFDPWVWKIPWRRKGYPLQYSCLENSMDRAWKVILWDHKEPDTTEQHKHTHTHRITYKIFKSPHNYLTLRKFHILLTSV